MGRGSVLKNFKSELQSNDLLRHQKKRKGDQQQAKQQRQRDVESLSAIRNVFNPFNAKFDNSKMTGDKAQPSGRPVAARSLAEEQRRRTWETEKRLKNKIGGLVDRRFGERDKSMNEEDKMVERFAREKLNNLRKASSRKSYNIEDESGDEYNHEDILTHGGKSLSFNDDFAEDDLGVSSEDESQPNKKVRVEGPTEDEDGENKPTRPKTKAEVMQEIIAKSKLHKRERQQQREEDDELVASLNAGYDDLMADLAEAEEQREKVKRDMDSYDVNLQELAFERRADPSDRTKTEEELAKERSEEKAAAERAKLARMEGDELDIEGYDAIDDANLFGLQDHSEDEGSAMETGSGANENPDADDIQQSHVSVPESLSSLNTALVGSENITDKIQHFIKIATPSRGSGSKDKLQNLMVAVLHYSLMHPDEFQSMCKIMHAVAPKNDVGLRLANETRDLVHSCKRRNKWGSRELLLFSLIGSLFSTSDHWHVVATSATLVITQRLSQSVEQDLLEISTNLFLCDLLLTYQRLSKRFIPEIPGYLLRVLALPSHSNRLVAERYVRTIETSKGNALTAPKITKDVQGTARLGHSSQLDEVFVITAKIAVKAASTWRSLESFPEVFIPIHQCLVSVPASENTIYNDCISRLDKLIHFSSKERKFLQLQEFRPVGIVTRAPMFDENYNPEVKGASLDPANRELQKLKALHKKERKSTLREIRRDAEFESRQILNEKRKTMTEYHDRLKQLEGQINGEEGAERNAYERERQKRKRR